MNKSTVIFLGNRLHEVSCLVQKANYRGIELSLEAARSVTEAKSHLPGAENYRNGEKHPSTLLLVLEVEQLDSGGFDLIKWARSTSKLSGLPILVLAPSDEDSRVQKALDCGANGYLTHSDSPDTLAEMVQSLRSAGQIQTLNSMRPQRPTERV